MVRPATREPSEIAGELDRVWRENRRYVLDIAFRMLGSVTEAEDVVQEAFARLVHVDLAQIDDVRGWLVVVVSRLCLDQLRSGRWRRQTLVDELGRRSYTTSIAFGPSIGKNIALAYLPWAYCQEGRRLAVQYFGETYPVEVVGIGYRSLYDPDNAKPRS